MRVVKTDWRNRNEKKLTDLLRVKVDGPASEYFHKNHNDKAVSLWCSNRKLRLHLPQQHIKRKKTN